MRARGQIGRPVETEPLQAIRNKDSYIRIKARGQFGLSAPQSDLVLCRALKSGTGQPNRY